MPTLGWIHGPQLVIAEAVYDAPDQRLRLVDRDWALPAHRYVWTAAGKLGDEDSLGRRPQGEALECVEPGYKRAVGTLVLKGALITAPEACWPFPDRPALTKSPHCWTGPRVLMLNERAIKFIEARRTKAAKRAAREARSAAWRAKNAIHFAG